MSFVAGNQIGLFDPSKPPRKSKQLVFQVVGLICVFREAKLLPKKGIAVIWQGSYLLPRTLLLFLNRIA